MATSRKKVLRHCNMLYISHFHISASKLPDYTNFLISHCFSTSYIKITISYIELRTTL